MDNLKKKRPSQESEDSSSQSTTNRKKQKESSTVKELPVDKMAIASQDMCMYCFDVIIAHHFRNKVEKPTPKFNDDCYPLFVTWMKGHELRGCIGTFSSLALHKGVKEYALTSALNDTRFDPISRDEIPKLSVTVSLLVNFEDASNYLDWTVGDHGIRISFNSNGFSRTATYLPQVAAERGWTKEETIESLLRKGGFTGNINQTIKDSIKLVRYRSDVVHMKFHEYVRLKDNVPAALLHPLTNGYH